LLPLGIHSFTLEQDNEKIKIRVVKFKLKGDEIETLVTNLFENLTCNDFKKLYFMRWPIETQYGALKNKLEIENFSSRTQEGILQDYYISVYLYNIIAIAANEVQPIIDEKRKDRGNKYKYKSNFNHAVGVMKNNYIRALLENDPVKMEELFSDIIVQMSKKIIPIRCNRSISRNPSPRKSKHHHNQKSNC
jgi:hypothetical protein